MNAPVGSVQAATSAETSAHSKVQLLQPPLSTAIVEAPV